MKKTLKIFIILGVSLVLGCGNGEKKTTDPNHESTPPEQSIKVENKVVPSERVDLTNKGVGPIMSVTLAPEIDQTMAARGKEVYDKMCIACHKADKKYIGPAPKGILERRTPEWVMNMILNPEVMIVQDPLAKELLMEFNGAPMANQNLTEEEARSILEYFRTL